MVMVVVLFHIMLLNIRDKDFYLETGIPCLLDFGPGKVGNVESTLGVVTVVANTQGV